MTPVASFVPLGMTARNSGQPWPRPITPGFFGTVSRDRGAPARLNLRGGALPQIQFIDLKTGMTSAHLLDPLSGDPLPRRSILTAGRPCLVQVIEGRITLTLLHNLDTFILALAIPVQAVALAS